MFKNRSIMAHTLLAVSIPLIIAFILVLLLNVDAVRKNGESFAREIMQNTAEQVSIRLEDRLAVMYTALNLTRRSLEAVDPADPDAEKEADRILKNMLLSTESVYSAWLAYEPGTFGKPERFIKSYLKSGRYAREINHITPAMLDDPAQSPWYDFPLRSGSNYFVNAERHDYGQGEGEVYRGTLSFPLMADGVVVGCVGIDVLYRQLLNFLADLEVLGDRRPISLVTGDGETIYSSGNGNLLVSKEDAELAAATKRTVLRYVDSPDGKGRVLTCLAPINIARSSVQTFLHIEVPSSDLTARSMPLVRKMALLSSLCFLLLGAGIYLVMRGLVRPVKELTRKADEVAKGNLDVDFGDAEGDASPDGGSASRNELRRLRQALKQMLRQLSDAHGLKLAAARADMEREKITAAAAVKSRFFATMSHEIRTPMNAITGLSEILLSRPLADEDRATVEDIRVSAVSLLRIINDILDTSKMEEGRFELKDDGFNLKAVLGNIDSIAALMAKQKGLDYRSNLDSAPEFIRGDAERLRQVLLNLLSNAIKYTPEGRVAFTALRDGDVLRFVVSDTGVGIGEKDLPHVFEAYHQADGGRQAGVEGTGLGLHITKQLTELMGGNISVKSAAGNGSVFKVEIPYRVGAQTDVRIIAARTAAPGEKNAAILVVDDNLVNVKVAQGFLKMLGYAADSAGSGREALVKAAGRQYDLIFMDHMMPEMDGVETMRRLRQHNYHYAKAPVIALTANVMAGAREELLRSGMNDFLAKPLELPALERILARWLPDAGKSDTDNQPDANQSERE